VLLLDPLAVSDREVDSDTADSADVTCMTYAATAAADIDAGTTVPVAYYCHRNHYQSYC
jgi:hypothetical protein